jgi:general transcription factor 3C polypeptide 5 (transcription factor C subunit 1)
VILKITVPKRTGRKRKRGSDDLFEFHDDAGSPLSPPAFGQSPNLLSQSRLDTPKELQRRLRDTKGFYQIEAVGTTSQTHRYRGLSDFTYDTTHQPFMQKFTNAFLPGTLDALKTFKLDPSRGPKPNEQL